MKSFIIWLLIVGFASLPILSTGQELVVDLKKVGQVIEAWANAHDTKDLRALERLYTDEVIFYSKVLPKSNCLDIKSKRLLSKKYLHLEIITQPIVTVYSSQIIKAQFTKRVTSGSVSTDYDSYLLLKQVGEKLLIMGESDVITDGNASFSPALGTELRRSQLSVKTFDPKKRQDNNEKPFEVDDKSSKIAEPIAAESWIALAIVTVGLTSAIFAGYVRYRRRRSIPKPQGKDIATTVQRRPPPRISTPPERPNQDVYKEDGDAFEKFILHRFDSKYFTLLDWRGDKVSNGVYPKSSTYPDLEMEFRFADLKTVFAVECKFRKALYDGVFKLEKRQFDNYLEFSKSKEMPVYVALGVGGEPNDPKDLYIIPLKAFGNDGSILYDDVCNYYDNPKHKFFYEPKLKRLRYARKSSQLFGRNV
jgi:hypothetical protein